MDFKKEEFLRLCKEEFMKVKEVDPIIKEQNKLEFKDYKERVKYEMINNILDNLNNLETTIKKLILR
jgi:hypothetical protein